MDEWFLKMKDFLQQDSKSSLSKVTKIIIGSLTLIAAIMGILSYLGLNNEEIDQRSEQRDIETQSQIAGVKGAIGDIKESVNRVSGIDCSILEKDWIPSSEGFVSNHSFFLASSQESANAAFSKKFSKFYNINVHLLPRVETSLNTVISVKDKQENELSFVVGDQDDSSARVSYKQKGINIELPNFGRKQVVPAIDTTQDIDIVISVGWSTDQVRVSSHFEYTPKGKEKTTWFTLLDTKISKERISDPVSLNVGIRNPDGTEREVKIMECLISPEDETLR